MLFDDLIFKTFLGNRGFEFKGKKVLAPYLELVNYSPKSATLLLTNEGIYHPDIDISDEEITHHYCYMSPLSRWTKCGFSLQEHMVFSLPFEFGISGSGLKFLCKGKSLDTEQINFPRINKTFIIEGLPIANINLKKFPINYLSYLSKSINVKFDLDNLLEKIVDYNIKTRIEVIEKIGKLYTFNSQSLIKALSIELQIIDNSL